METVTNELLELERYAKAVLEAMPALKQADKDLKGSEKLKAIKAIGDEYDLSFQ